MKKEILILGILLVVAATLGCTNNAQPGEQSGSGINFSMPEGWELHPMPGDGVVIWMEGDPRIRVIEMTDQQKFNSKHNSVLAIDKNDNMVKTKNQTMEGIKVETFWTTNGQYGDIQDYYFFQKNNKYYYITAWAYTGWDSSKQTIDRQEINNAVETIVKTIK